MSYTYEDLCEVMDRLLGEGGCPWDRSQTHESLRESYIEECYEVIDAINKKDVAGLCEELGDVLMLTVFHMKLAERAGEFTPLDVTTGICNKMISRHSHIFGEDEAKTSDEVIDNWEKNKRIEKGYKSATESLRSVAKTLPALMRAEKIIGRAEKAGMDLGSVDDAVCRIEEKLSVLKGLKNDNKRETEEEIGQICWEVTKISHLFKINADFALTNAEEEFINRFEDIENSGVSSC